MRTTKIIVEEAAASPEVDGTFTYSQCSRKSEISVEEVASFSLNAPYAETTVSAHKDISIHAVVEETESDGEFGRKMSRGISIVSVSEDEKIITEKEHVEEKDDEMEKLMERIQKQRNVLGEILEQESVKAQESSSIEKAKENSVVEESDEIEDKKDFEEKVKETEIVVEVKETKKIEEIKKIEKVVEIEEKLVEIKEPVKEEEIVVNEEPKMKQQEQPEGSLINILKFFTKF